MTEYFIKPEPKPRMTRSDKWNKRPCVVRYFNFCDRVRDLGIEIPVPCKITFFIPMPPSWSDAKRAAYNGQPHLQTPDADNLAKAVMDAVFKDDSHVWSIWAEKRWRDRPGILVEAL